MRQRHACDDADAGRHRDIGAYRHLCADDRDPCANARADSDCGGDRDSWRDRVSTAQW